jgi:SAM-dependent methyltransferase
METVNSWSLKNVGKTYVKGSPFFFMNHSKRGDPYSETPNEYHDRTFYLNPEPFLSRLSRYVFPPALVLDVGCGSGRDLLWLKNRGYTVLGLERSPGLAKLARQNANCEVILGDFEVFDFSRISVNAVILIGSLVHVGHDQFRLTLSRIIQGLRQDGYVLLTMKQGQGTSTVRDGRVFVLWQDVELRNIFTEMDFQVEDSFLNTSVLGTGEVWLGYILHKRWNAMHG